LCAAFPAGPASAADLDKAISFSGPQSLRSDDNANDYRLWGNRLYVQQSHTRWVKLWVSWYDVQQDYTPTSRADSWRQLDKSANLTRLDAQVRAANADGVHVLLSLYQAFPTWANGASGPDPLSSKPAIEKLPLDLSPGGPWGWFVGYLSNRYDGTSALAGRVDALEVVNEPNLLYWPQDAIAANTATMMRAAEQVSFVYGQQAIVGPATSDYPDPGGARAGVNTDWRTFTAGVLDALAGWQPRVPVHWSQHNYRDVKYEDPPETSRAKQTIDMLAAGGWPEPALWLTEGGLNLGSSWADPAARDAQAAKISKNFEAMRSLPEVALWTQHGINDVAVNDFKSGLRDDFDAALPGPGGARPAWTTWLSLDGTRPATEPLASAAGAGEPPPGEVATPAESPPATSTTPGSPAILTAAAQPAPVANSAEAATPAELAGTTVLPSAVRSATVCMLSAPKSLGRSIRIGRRSLLTLPRTRLTAGSSACRATVTVTSRRMRATKAIDLEPDAASSITIKVKQPHASTAVAIRISVRSPGFGDRTWHTQLVRS
jgi:hypothetical protein